MTGDGEVHIHEDNTNLLNHNYSTFLHIHNNPVDIQYIGKSYVYNGAIFYSQQIIFSATLLANASTVTCLQRWMTALKCAAHIRTTWWNGAESLKFCSMYASSAVSFTWSGGGGKRLLSQAARASVPQCHI